MSDRPVVPLPGEVRAQLAPPSRVGGEPVLRVAPATAPTLAPALAPAAAPVPGAAEAGRPGGAVLAQGQALVDGLPEPAQLRSLGRGRHVLLGAGGRARVVLEAPEAAEGGAIRREVLVDGFRFLVDTVPERLAALRERASAGRSVAARGGALEVRAVIPGRVVSVAVEAGEEVSAGQQLLVVEAMKMQNELRAPRDGTIGRVAVAAGARIELGDLLVVIEERRTG